MKKIIESKKLMMLDTPLSVSVCNSDLQGEVNLQWDSVPGAITYIIEFKTDIANSWMVADTVISSKCTITGLRTNLLYCFRVAALNAKGQSKWSKTIKKKLIIIKGETKMKHFIKTLAIFTVLFVLTLASDAQVSQQWAARHNSTYNKDDYGVSVGYDNSGNVYVSGNIQDAGGSYRISTLKYNSAGNIQWSVVYQSPFNNGVNVSQMKTDNSGNVYIAGTIYNPSLTGYDFLILKYSSSGNLLWSKSWSFTGSNSNDFARSIAIDASGNVFVTGQCDVNAGPKNISTIKYNSAGTQQWVQIYSTPNITDDDAGSKIVIDASGNCYVTGFGVGSGTGKDIITLKYNSTGSLQWAQRYSGNYEDAGIDIIVNGSGTVYVTGYTFTTLTNSDYISIKYNSNGVQQWIKTYNGTGNSTDKSNSIGLDAADNVYITGYSIGNGSSFDFATIKYNSSGTQQWVQRYNGPGNLTDAANDMFTDASGNCYVTGNSFGSSSFSDYAVIKYNSSGSQQWVQRYNGPANDYDYSGNINVDASGNVYVIGNSEGIGTMRDFATIKYSQTTGIEPIEGTIPDKFNLSQNYPNPFNPKTNIEFSLPVRGNVKISIFDLLGKEVSVLVNDFMKAGTYKTGFDASALSSGTYFYRIETEGFTDTKKMILIK